MSKATVRTYLPIIFLLLFCVFELKAFCIPAWPKSHDGIYHTIRINDYIAELSHGQFPVRWVDALDYRYGLPLFTYIYPGPYMLSSLSMAVSGSDVLSYKLIMFVGYALGVIGTYALCSKKSKFFALAAAILFGLTPYIFLDVFVRGALAEILAIGFMPWVLYGLVNRKFALAAIALCFVLISHNFFGIFFLLFLLLFLVWNGTFDRKTLGTILLGIGLAAFFLIPMLVESRFIDSGAGNGYLFNYQDHFVYLPQLFYSKWGFGYSVPGPGDGISFQLGFANILILAGSCIALVTVKRKKYLALLLLVVLGSTFLTLTYSQFIWDRITFLHGLTLYPWRLLFVSAILCPLLFYESISNIYKRHPLTAYGITIALVILAIINTRNYRQATEYIPINAYRQMEKSEGQKTSTFSRYEIAPIWSKEAKSDGDRVIYTQTKEEIPSVTHPEYIGFTITSTEPVRVTILKNYFPGWRLRDVSHAKDISIQPDSQGNVTVTLPSGTYEYRYGQTAVEIVSDFISIISVILLFWYMVQCPHKRRRARQRSRAR